MALKTHSVFYFGHIIDDNNNLINFKEGAGPELTAQIPVGSYTLTKFLEVILAALNAESSLTWTGSINRTTGVITILSSGTASLLFGSGSTYLNSPALLLGFPQTDILNSTSFVGSSRSGYEYRPQFPLQDYKGKEKNKKLVNAVVTKSASGDNVSVQSFGTERFIKMNIKYITNQPTEGKLRFSATGVEDAQTFMDYIVEKHPIEFMEDEADLNTYERVYLDSAGFGGEGTSYELMEYVDRNLPEFFESGLLTFKIINIE